MPSEPLDMEMEEDVENMEEDDTIEEEGGEHNNEGPKKAFLPGDQVEDGEELVMDEDAYLLYHQATLGPPCLSFDLLPDDLGDDRSTDSTDPIAFFGVAGSQAEKANQNAIMVFKMSNLHSIKKKPPKDDDDEEETDSESEDENGDPQKEPKLQVAGIQHAGCINRIKQQRLGATSVVAAWSEMGSVGIWSLDRCLKKLDEPFSAKKDGDQFRDKSSPLFQFSHGSEGFSMAWSPMTMGVLATGDCKKNIFIWKPAESGSWDVNPKPFSGHTASVEDIQWSPNEGSVMATCSVDKTIRIWDCRAGPDKACMLTAHNSHDADVNVIDWNKNEPFIVSGGDDGAIKIWDLRVFDKGEPVAVFNHHKGPVTSVEWNHSDATVLASSGADDQIALWDLALERDEDQEENPELKNLPPQLLFIHQGLQDIKEIHWHKQIPGVVVSTSHSGFDVFRTISV